MHTRVQPGTHDHPTRRTGLLSEEGRISVWLLILIPLGLLAFGSGFMVGWELARLLIVALIVAAIIVAIIVQMVRGPGGSTKT